MPPGATITSTYSHIGWVPCITGRLFFRHARVGLGRLPHYANYISRQGQRHYRHIVVGSTVDWRDVAVDASGRPTTGRYRVLLITRFASGSESIAGDICLLPERCAGDLYADVDRQLADIQTAMAAGEELDKRIELLQRTLRQLTPSRQHSEQKIVHFRLDQCGIAFLRLKAADIYDDATEHAAVRSAYYYLKNTWHIHKHHHPLDESLTTIHDLRRGLPTATLDMLDDLKESATARHRNAHPADAGSVSQAQGILSYASSLIATLNEQGYLSHRQHRLEQRYLENLRTSLHVTYETHLRIIADRRLVDDRLRNYVLFLLAVLAPATLMYREVVLQGIQRDGIGLNDHLVVQLFIRFFGSDYGVLAGMVVLIGPYTVFALIVGGGLRTFMAQSLPVRWWINRVAPRRYAGRLAAAALGVGGVLLLVLAVLLLLP